MSEETTPSTEIMQSIMGLDDRDRYWLFDELRKKFCMHCGCEQPAQGRGCQCWNDE